MHMVFYISYLYVFVQQTYFFSHPSVVHAAIFPGLGGQKYWHLFERPP